MDSEESIVEEDTITLAPEGKARKRSRHPENWRKARAKRMRYSSKTLPKMPTCNHKGGPFTCKELGMQDIRRMHEKFYTTPDRQVQNEFILKFVTVETPHRKRSRKNMQENKLTTKYFLNKKCNGVVTRVQVCKKAFVDTLCVSRDRVQNLCKRYFEEGTTPVDKRGGDTRSNAFSNKREAVRAYIKSICPVEKHYCRSKNVHRYYLSSDLSIVKLHHMYNEGSENNLKVKYEFFRTVFERDFNIGFGTPATDVCSFCLMHKDRIRLTNDEEEKATLTAELTVHIAKSKAFYSKLQTPVEGVKIISFDCQKNLILPKLPDQSAYYLRQLYYYNLTVCEGSSKDKQTKENTFCYVWLESEYAKGSCEIASSIYDRLCTTSLENINTIMLVADGCGGQNKNSIVVGMVCTWLAKNAPPALKKIILLFPIVGHSYIPPDRIFGRIEREVGAKSTIVNPQEYEAIFDKVGTVFKLGIDLEVYDWKTAILGIPKHGETPAVPGTAKAPGNWHFQFMPSKKIILTKHNMTVKVQGEVGYNVNIGVPQSICKKGKSWNETNPQPIQKGAIVKVEKLNDLKSLLQKHYGPEWDEQPNLIFYKQLLIDQENLLNRERNVEDEAEDDAGDIPAEEENLQI